MICLLVLGGEITCEGGGEIEGGGMVVLVYRLLMVDDGGCIVG